MAPDRPPGTTPPDKRLAALLVRRGKLTPAEAALLRAMFADIFRAHRRQVAAQITRRIGDSETVSDLLQDVFVDLHTWILENGFPDDLRAFLFASTRGKVSNLARAERRSPVSVGLPSSDSEPPRTGPDAERALDVRTLVPQLLDQLSDEHREVVERLILLRESHAEAAAALDIPVPTLKSRLMAAKRHLYELALPLLPASQRCG